MSSRFLVLIFLMVSAQGFSQRSATQVIDAWVTMWNSYDLNQVDKLFDRSVTYFSSERPGLIRGIDSLRKHHESFGFIAGGKKSGNKLWLENKNVQEIGSRQIITASWLFQRDGSDIRQRGPVTFVLIKKGDSWLILHAHFSNDLGK